MLALAEVEERHDCCFLVLRGVAFQDFGDQLLIDGVEFEGYGGVVFWAVAVLETVSVHASKVIQRAMGRRSTDNLKSFARHLRCGT